MEIFLAPLVLLIGVIAYGFSKDGKVMELARIAVFCGLFVTLLEFQKHFVLP